MYASAPTNSAHEIVVVGGGIVGLATAWSLLRKSKLNVAVLEAERHLASHQTGRNSGVIHSGLYYTPGSLKAQLCVEGMRMLYAYCDERHLNYVRCGKVVVATAEHQVEHLDTLRERGLSNGLSELTLLSTNELERVEPAIRGVAGLHVGETGIVDYREVALALARDVERMGGIIYVNSPLEQVRKAQDEIRITTPDRNIMCSQLINCAGLQSDRVCRLCGIEPPVSIVPFKGRYWALDKRRSERIKGLVYPVPDPRYPFLGVHLTKTINDQVLIGPDAFLSFARHGYEDGMVDWTDIRTLLNSRGFWCMAAKNWRKAATLAYQSSTLDSLLRAAQQLMPEITADDLRPARCGVRAQAVDLAGQLVDDFCIVNKPQMCHVLNAPSPAATAALAIGSYIAQHLD